MRTRPDERRRAGFDRRRVGGERRRTGFAAPSRGFDDRGGRLIEPYPEPPSAQPGRDHRVRVAGASMFVERYADLSYVRFAMDGPASVEVEVPVRITRHVIFPAERVSGARVDGNRLRFELTSPAGVVIWIDDLEKLVLLPDPFERDRPVRGSPGVLDVTDLGADPTGDALATMAIQDALDRAALPGGGTVLVPPGLFRTGTLTLRSGVRLHLAPGAVLQGSANPADYPIDPGRHETAADERLPPDRRFLGRTMTFSRLLLVDRASDVRITGRGTIDGNGTHLRTRYGAAPNLLRVRESHAIRIEDVLFRNAAAWTVHLLASNDIDVRNVKVINDRANLNTDGIDPDMSSDVTIDRCFIYTKDDAICVKATGNSDLSGNPARISATGNLVSSCDAALKVGTESSAATFSDIRFEDDHVFESGRAMSVVVRDGAVYERLRFSGIRVGPSVEHLVEQVIGVRDPDAGEGVIGRSGDSESVDEADAGPGLGSIHDLTFEDVSAPAFRRPAANWTWYAQFRPGRPTVDADLPVFEGADEAHAVDRLTLRTFVVNGEHLRDAKVAARVANLTVGRFVRSVTYE